MHNIGIFIKQKRKEKGLTLEEVAKVVGVTKATVSRWENGFIKNIKNDKIGSLCNLLNISPNILIRNNSNNEFFELDSITKKQFKKSVYVLISKCNALSQQERLIIKSVISAINEQN